MFKPITIKGMTDDLHRVKVQIPEGSFINENSSFLPKGWKTGSTEYGQTLMLSSTQATLHFALQLS